MTQVPSGAAIRRQFLDFFAERGHQQVPSAPVFPQDDPTLLFTNAGMNQFKDVFLGTGKRDYSRAVDTQKCIRVSGKHNDLEEVGLDSYHHTFFEMLGNWSFGDYFKQDAIPWAWELLTEVWGLEKERLWVTVFEGDSKDGLPADEEAATIWRDRTDIDPARILRFGRRDNFWEMGETGPCGPCTEIHFDRGGEGADPAEGADSSLGVNAGNERFIELWNNVFMEFNRLDDGSLRPLPARHVDTGLGLERVVAVLQGVQSNYDTDLFRPIFDDLSEHCGRPYAAGQGPADVAFRVAADHVRAVSVAFADGALPGNGGRGYVLRRLIRRASRHGRQSLGLEDPFLHRLVPAVVRILGDVFPEIAQREEHIATLVRSEEESFGATLGRGLVRFSNLAERVDSAGTEVIPGAEAYELYATYGFPRDLIELMARERCLAVDGDGWAAAEGAHRDASRADGAFKQLLSAEELEGLPPTESTCHEAGPGACEQETTVVLCVERPGAEAGRDCLILGSSPFYPEAGGQVGDRGVVAALDGTFRFQVRDTQRMGDLVVHVGRMEGVVGTGQEVLAQVDRGARRCTQQNHTATHLLHRALKEELGDHVAQQGSYVGPDRLRFDLSQPKALTREEVDAVERRVNARVHRNDAVETTVEDLDAARARGVVALFGEKYGERVRVVDVGGWSTELCGGTHCSAAGDIGLFVITGEAAIQAGVRRIEALTGDLAVAWVQDQRRILNRVAHNLKVAPGVVPDRVEALQAAVKDARRSAASSSAVNVDQIATQVREGLRESGGARWGAAQVDLGQDGLRDLATRLKGAEADLALVIIGRDGERVPWIALSQGETAGSAVDVRECVGPLREHLGGGGGGKADLAQGQGVNPEGIASALEATSAILGGKLDS